MSPNDEIQDLISLLEAVVSKQHAVIAAMNSLLKNCEAMRASKTLDLMRASLEVITISINYIETKISLRATTPDDLATLNKKASVLCVFDNNVIPDKYEQNGDGDRYPEYMRQMENLLTHAVYLLATIPVDSAGIKLYIHHLTNQKADPKFRCALLNTIELLKRGAVDLAPVVANILQEKAGKSCLAEYAADALGECGHQEHAELLIKIFLAKKPWSFFRLGKHKFLYTERLRNAARKSAKKLVQSKIVLSV